MKELKGAQGDAQIDTDVTSGIAFAQSTAHQEAATEKTAKTTNKRRKKWYLYLYMVDLYFINHKFKLIIFDFISYFYSHCMPIEFSFISIA